MRLVLVFGLVLGMGLIGCGGEERPRTAEDPYAEWFSSPTKVVEGIMYSYQTRNDSLYAAFLAEDFRYFFEPEGADSMDILGWGKEEEVVATGNLFRTADVDRLDFNLHYGEARPATEPGQDGWMVVPVSGGEMIVSVRNKEPMQVALNRQEIVLRPVGSQNPTPRWEVVEWHDYPAPEPGE
jgi:hypothetical protein